MPLKSLIVLLLLSMPLSAKTLWSDFSITYLNGSDYKVGDNQREVVTIEHASGTNWGDTFLFFERMASSNDDVTFYGEFSPRITLSDYSAGAFSKIYFSSTVEANSFSPKSGKSSDFVNVLLGVGTDIKVPGFKFIKLSAYHRNNELADNNYQLTLSWAIPFNNVVYDGFIDWFSTTEDQRASMNFTSQLKYNLSSHLNLTTPLYVGLEYVFWQNKFGIENINERNANFLVKYHF